MLGVSGALVIVAYRIVPYLIGVYSVDKIGSCWLNVGFVFACHFAVLT